MMYATLEAKSENIRKVFPHRASEEPRKPRDCTYSERGRIGTCGTPVGQMFMESARATRNISADTSHTNAGQPIMGGTLAENLKISATFFLTELLTMITQVRT